jgi:hypothetical protein
MRRRLTGLALLMLMSGCATAPTQRDRDMALLKDARECEADADGQLEKAAQTDPGLRLLFFQACMSLRGWHSE